MNILNKLKENAVSVIPVMVIVLLLGLTAVPMDGMVLGRFVFGGFLLILGLTVFLLGVDLGIQPMGERCGAELTKKRNLPLLMGTAFVIGFMVTIAEPDIQVFSDQVKSVFDFMDKMTLIFMIAGGVGLFIMLGLLRTVLKLSLKWTIFISYLILFIFAMFIPDAFLGIAFDSGGATTGPMTVPFILALGLGVSSVRSDDRSSFGLTGITSIGPVIAVLIYSFIISRSLASGGAGDSLSSAAVAATLEDGNVSSGFFAPFGQVFSSVVSEAAVSILPLVIMLVVFQITLLKMSRRQVIRVVIGLVYSFLGLVIFLTGVNGGFMPAGSQLGVILGQKAAQTGGIWFFLLILTGLVLGAIVVCAEPAVWVLTEQVEQVSSGTIKRKVLLMFLAAGTSAAIGLALWRAVAGFSIKWLLIPGYATAMFLMIFSPHMFTGIAFDSGGVASGPITSTFVLSFTLGAAKCASGNTDAFGVIALVAMMPLIAIQLLGIIYSKKQHRNGEKQK